MAGNIDQDIETIAHAESGEDVRYAIVRAIQDLNQNGGNAQTLNGYSSDEFTKNPQFEQFIDEEVGQIHLVLDAINKGITLRVIELGNKWIGPEANDDVQIQVPDTVRDRQLLTVDDFYADIVEVEGGTGENASWQKSDRYDSALGIYHYAHGALAGRVKLHFYAKRASATAVQDYNVHARDRITANDTYTADPGEAWDTVTVDVPIKEEITCNVTENHREYVPTNPGTTSYNKVVVDVPDSLEQGGVVINQATFDQTFTPTSPNVGFSNFRVQADVRFNTQPKEVRISDAEFEDITVTPDSTYAGLSQVSIVNDMQLEEVTVNQNGDVTPGPGYTALKKVTVQVPQQSIETGKSVAYSSGGTYTVNPSSGFNAMDSVEVTVQTPVLQPSKSVTLSQSGTIIPDPGYNAMEEVVVTVSGGGGNIPIMNQSDWDRLPLADKIAQGLTVIRDYVGQPTGFWKDMSHMIVDIIKEFFNNTSETVSLQANRYNHLIYFQPQWRNGRDYSYTIITDSNIAYSSVDTGGIKTLGLYDGSVFNAHQVAILHDVTFTDSSSITISNKYTTDGGAIIAVPFNSICELIGERFEDPSNRSAAVYALITPVGSENPYDLGWYEINSNGLYAQCSSSETTVDPNKTYYEKVTDTFTTGKRYDYVLFIAGKWSWSGYNSNGVYTISAGNLIQTGSEQLFYSGSSDAMTALYRGVASGTTITLGNGLSSAHDCIIAIGINEITS